MSSSKNLDHSRLRNLVPGRVQEPARIAVTVQRRIAALRTILRANAFDQEWYEAQSGLSFGSTGRACWHYLRYGRMLGRSPHPLFEPSIAWPLNYDREAAHDPLARHLRGEMPPSGRVHPGLASSWSATVRGRPAWLAWAGAAGPDTPVPVLWSDRSAPLTWPEFRRRAIVRAADTHRMLELRRDIRVRLSAPTWVVEEPVVEEPVVEELPQLSPSGTDADAPLVSIILPTWNRAPILRAAVASVAAQTLEDWELIIVDDGSDDDTLLVLEELARHDARVRVIPLAHGGVCRARNRGLEAARGRWIAFLDSDNTWRPDFLQRIVAFAESRQVPWAHAVLQMMTDEGVRYRAFEGTREHLLVGNHIDLNVMVALREVFEEVGGFDETLRRAVDYDLVLRLSKLAAPSLAPFVGAIYADSRQDDRRISVAESPMWNAVVSLRHLIDVDAERGRPRVRGRVSIVVPVRTRGLDAAELIDALRGAAPDVEVIVVVAGRSESVARGLAVAAVGSSEVRVVHWSADLTWSSCIDLGATHASGEYLVAWRPNCVPVPGWWGPLRQALEDTDTAMAQPLTLMPDGRVSSAGATFEPPDPFPSPLLAGFPVEDARPLGTSRIPAAYAGVLALRTDDFWALDGIDPIFGSALGEVDLSLRAGVAGVGATAVVTEAQVVARDPRRYRFAPDVSGSARIMRLRHADPPSSAAIWDRLGFEVVGQGVRPLAAPESTPVEPGATPVVRPPTWRGVHW